jgi:hypothetical protein
MIILCQAIFQMQTMELQFLTFIGAHWLPVLNPIASILTNRPYRDAIFCATANRIEPYA